MRSLRVLVVDDDPMNLEVAGVILDSAGHRASMAHDGQQAVTMATMSPFDVILMDISMPVMDGITATEQLRAHPATAATPIIFVTGSNSDPHIGMAMAAGGQAVLLKPYKRQQLLDLIDEVVRA